MEPLSPSRNTRLDSDFLARLPASPNGYPQKIDLVRELILCVELDAAAYRSASFLDDRMLGPAIRGSWFSIERIHEASRQVARPLPLHFIFHAGHVGSTLVSRLLDATGCVLSLREPLPLRTLAEALEELHQPWSLLSQQRFDEILGFFLRLWSRGYDTTDCVVVKATSSAGCLAPVILQSLPASRAVYLNVRAETYLATLLAGANSSIDLRGHGPGRMRRLQARIGGELQPLHAMSPGELIAMSWLVESFSQHDAVGKHPGQVIAIDFDQLLEGVGSTMDRILGHYGLEGGPDYLRAVASGAVMASYSKAPEIPFTPSQRRQLLNDARRLYAHEIRKGLDWLEAAAKAENTVAQLLAARGV